MAGNIALALEIYAAGVALIWFLAWRAIAAEPTTHGQDVLFGMGCFLGILWPLAVIYFVIASPFIVASILEARGER